jgi:hypothetical protein
MGERCAVCGAADVWKEVPVPDAWAEYLADQQDLAPADGNYVVPACNDCSGDVDMQKALDGALEEMDDDTATLLDGLDVDALLEEPSA